MSGVVDEVAIGEKFRALAGELNERQRRLWAASEARAAGRGGIAATARATGISVPTIRKGIAELEVGERLEPGRVRRPGGGRKRLTEVDPTLLEDLERLVDADSRGDPESLLRWTSKSVRHLAEGLRELGHQAAFHDGREAAAAGWGTACRRTSRPARAASIPTATRSSGTSTRSPSGRSIAASR